MYGIKKVFATRLSDVDVVDREGVGTIRIEGNRVYKYLKILNVTATVAGVAGDAIGYGADKYDLNTAVIDESDADTIPIPAGILCGTVAGVLATAYYCWSQIVGPAIVTVTVAGSAVAGDPFRLVGGTTDKTFTRAIEADSAGPYKFVAGILQDATNKQVVLTCPW